MKNIGTKRLETDRLILRKFEIYDGGSCKRSIDMKKEAASIGIIGIPNEETITMLEKEWGKPIKKIEKNGKIILLVGKGLFKRRIVIPIEK